MPRYVSAALAAILIFLSLTVVLLMAQRPAWQPTAVQTEEAATAEAISSDPCSSTGLIAAKTEIDSLLAAFEENASLAALYEAGEAYRQIALDCGYLPENFDSLVINSTDVPAIMVALESLTGDPLNGQLIYNGEEPSASGDTLTCGGCHEGGAVAPPTEGTWTRWDEERHLEPRFADYTFEQYIVESVVLPWDYFVPTYPEYTMPDIYHEQLSYQNLADIVAFLNSQDQLPE